MATVDDFKSKLVGGGARSNLFKVIMNFPAFAGGNTELASFMIKNAQIPEAMVGSIEVPFRGRKLKVAGDREFANINFTVINDTNFAIRNAFERWIDAISSNQGNVGLSDPASYTSDVLIQQLDKKQNVVKEYKVVAGFPTNVAAIDLSFDSENQIEEFTVELAYQYWESDTTS
jgi:hypothetical protein